MKVWKAIHAITLETPYQSLNNIFCFQLVINYNVVIVKYHFCEVDLYLSSVLPGPSRAVSVVLLVGGVHHVPAPGLCRCIQRWLGEQRGLPDLPCRTQLPPLRLLWHGHAGGEVDGEWNIFEMVTFKPTAMVTSLLCRNPKFQKFWQHALHPVLYGYTIPKFLTKALHTLTGFSFTFNLELFRTQRQNYWSH